MYDFQFNRILARDMGLYVIQRPDIPFSEREYVKKYIKGRDGSLTIEGSLKDIEWTFACNYMTDEDAILEKARQLKAWLQGSGELIVTDDKSVYYQVKHADIFDFTRPHKRKAQFKVKFTCEPFAYDNVTGHLYVNYKDLGINNGEVSEPDYIIKGSGTCVITVNSKIFRVTVNGKAEINTNKRLINQGGTIINNQSRGIFTDLFLQHGENTVTVSSGFELTIKPNWRYR